MNTDKLGTIYTVSYNPVISENLTKSLKEVSPSLYCEDSAMYSVGIFIETLEGRMLSLDEQDFLQQLVDNNIDYIEI